jgi:hypothetical protein
METADLAVRRVLQIPPVPSNANEATTARTQRMAEEGNVSDLLSDFSRCDQVGGGP